MKGEDAKVSSVTTIIPAFNEKCIALAMGISDEYTPYLYVSLSSILAHASAGNNYDIVILTSGVTEQNRNMLLQLATGKNNVSIRFVSVDEIISSYTFFIRDWFHPIIYARLLIPDLMSDYERVLYLDSDTVALTDIAELYSADLHGKILGGVRDTAHVAVYSIPNSDVKFDLDVRLKLRYPHEYINTGVLLYDIQRFRKEYTSSFLMEYSSSNEWKWQDQDIFMTLCEGKIRLLPCEWNVLVHGPIRDKGNLMERTAPCEMFEEYLRARNNPKIVHYVANSFLLVRPFPDLFPYFWQYARQTPYYEEILFRVFQKNYLRTNLQSVWDNFNRLEAKIDQHIGSKEEKGDPPKSLKSLLGKLLPANSKCGYIARMWYHRLFKDKKIQI